MQFWRRGDEGAPVATARAMDAADHAAHILLHANVVDTWMLADNLRLVLQDSFASSLWQSLRGRAPTWNNLWRRHIGLLADDDRPVVEIWPSQRRALEAGLLDATKGSLVARMPTSAGKTRMAEFAILAAIGARPGENLAVYVVPTRALAAEVEWRLSESLGAVGFRVSALFGGLENVDYELALVDNTDILIVTPERYEPRMAPADPHSGQHVIGFFHGKWSPRGCMSGLGALLQLQPDLEPRQATGPTAARYRPLDNVVIEIHSHHRFAGRFSPTDDADEQALRVYGVLTSSNRAETCLEPP